MGKPTATEDSIRAIPVGAPSLQNNCPSGTQPSDVLANPSQFVVAIFKVGAVKVKVEPGTTSKRIAQKICHRNGLCLPRSKAGKALLDSIADKILQDGLALTKTASAADIISKLEKNARRKINKANNERRQAAEREMRSAMKKWDFSLEEVTQMWQDRMVEAVHER